MRQLKITKSITNRNTASLDKYLQDIGKEDLITAEEEVELARRIKTGDNIALEKLTKANLRFVVSVAKQYQNQGLTLPDLINEGNLGLIKAAKKFDETRGFKFISYAVWWIRQSILQAIAEQSKLVRLPLNQVGSINRIRKVTSKLEQQFERQPSEIEIANELEVPKRKVKSTLGIATRYVSMDAPLPNDEDSKFLDVFVPKDTESTDESLMKESLGNEIQRSLSTLSEKERDIINMYYGIGRNYSLTLEEIGAKFGLTRERVRQIKEKSHQEAKTYTPKQATKGLSGSIVVNQPPVRLLRMGKKKTLESARVFFFYFCYYSLKKESHNQLTKYFIMTKVSNTNGVYEESLNDWAKQEMIANEFIMILSKLFYNKSIELVLFRSQLIDRSASLILYRHSYAENIINKRLNIKDSLKLAKAILHSDIVPSKIDIGKLNGEWVDERKNFVDAEDFINFKLKDFMGPNKNPKKPADIVLYGFGRIGRLLARELIIQGNGHQLRVRAIVTRGNDTTQIIKRAALLRHDSVHGPFRGVAIENADDKRIYINGHEVLMLAANNPEDIDYTQYGIDNAILIDNTGIYRDREGLSRHLKAKGIAKVLLTAPGKGDIPNIVFGVNEKIADYKKETVFSAASCTTNAAAPVLSVLENNYGIEQGHLETVHSYTNDQNLLDNMHKKSRRGRSAPLNLVITETGAAKAVTKIIPTLQGKLTGNAIRVPTPNVSLVILKLTLKKEVTKEEINELMRQTSLSGDLVAQVKYSTSADAVSSDFISEPATSVFDSEATIIGNDKKNIVLYIWYDNEFGYALQVIRVAKNMGDVKRPTYY